MELFEKSTGNDTMDSLSIQAVADLINVSKGDEDDDSEVCLSDRFHGDVYYLPRKTRIYQH